MLLDSKVFLDKILIKEKEGGEGRFEIERETERLIYFVYKLPIKEMIDVSVVYSLKAIA